MDEELGNADARVLAHEIRNPLNGAVIHLTFVERQLRRLGADDETLEALTVVEREIRRAAELISEYLEPAGGKRARRRTSLRTVCARAVELLTGRADAAGISIDALCEGEDVPLDLDAGQLESVLLELLENAVQAALESDGKVLLSAKLQGENAVIDVRHGRPLGASEVSLTSVEPRLAGVDIALKAITDQGGSLDVTSGPQGTTFRVRLPAIEPAAAGFIAGGRKDS
jgi:signal transduction histidine kinase